jgi:hypothetical protein
VRKRLADHEVATFFCASATLSRSMSPFSQYCRKRR